MKFESNRDIVHRSTLGHAIEFLKGVPTEVPNIRALHSELMAIGILPVEGDTAAAVESVSADSKPLLAPDDVEQRFDDVQKAIKALLDRNNPSDFTGGGHPRADSVTAAVGYKVDQKEVRDVWVKVREAFLAEKAKG